MSAKKQINKLYTLNFLGNISIAGAAWVLLLVSRGFSLIEVGFAETVFHLVSILCEIPSGMFADVVGRKKSLLLSCVTGALSGLFMIVPDNYAGVLFSIACSALTYNLCTGTDSAMAYDTLLENGLQSKYDGYISNQTIIYRISNGLATLAAGVALIIGNTLAQMLGIFIEVIRFLIILTMEENKVVTSNNKTLGARIRECVVESLGFLKGNRRVAKLIFRNALVGAIDILLLFFLQAKLPMTGISDWILGPLLFIMSMGGVLGAYISKRLKGVRFGKLFAVCLVMVSAGFLAEFTGVAWIMTVGGFLAAFADDLVQIRADVELNQMVPAAQRATLISVSSWVFSLVMIVMSPLAGWLFSL
ncbi:MAG: MFS transporter [Clostridiales bacterium]|nr:MFS transporter [Clostridiales bacterium]